VRTGEGGEFGLQRSRRTMFRAGQLVDRDAAHDLLIDEIGEACVDGVATQILQSRQQGRWLDGFRLGEGAYELGLGRLLLKKPPSKTSPESRQQVRCRVGPLLTGPVDE
jgi:hypothetical protein